MTAREIASALKARSSGKNSWMARCPAHPDKNPSLSITEGRDGKPLLHCHTGCSQSEVIEALKGLGLWEQSQTGSAYRHDSAGERNETFAEMTARITHEYDYTDEKGNVLYQCVRLRDPKEFKQRHRQGDKWTWNLQGVRLVPYHLPKLLAAPLDAPVLIVEGEKDVATAERLGFVATCNPMGAGKWKPELYNPHFSQRHVVSIPDKDIPKQTPGKPPKPDGWPGKQHAEFVCRSLLGTAATVRMLWLPGESKDLTDWAEGDPRGTREELLRLIAACAPLTARDLEDVAAVPATKSRPSAIDGPVDFLIELNDPAKLPELVDVLSEVSGPERFRAYERLEDHFGKKKIRDLRQLVADETSARLRSRDPELPAIYINNKYRRDLTAEALKALQIGNEPPRFFQRSGEMTEVVYGMRKKQLMPIIRGVTESALGGRLDRCANFLTRTRSGDTPTPPPIDVVRDLLSMDPLGWDLPELMGIVETPTLRPDGTIIDKAGYDPDTQLFYCPAPGLKIPELPDKPEAGDVDAAKDCIEDVIGQFPFVDEASRTNMYALLLTPILRPMFDGGPSALALIDAPAPGTGKTLLVDVMAIISTGRPAAVTQMPFRDEEFRKLVFSFLLAGSRLIVFDNLEGTVRSPVLASAVTSREYTDRQLGASTNPVVPNLATWVANGNNVRPGGDITRRCYQIRLDAKCSDPHRRSGFKRRLPHWAYHQRGQILHSLLVLAKHWCASGQPRYIKRELGSFEDWHQVVGSVLHHAGMPEFMANMDDLAAQSDESAKQWERFLEVLEDHFRHGEEFTIGEFLQRLTDSPPLKEALPDSLHDSMNRKAGSERQAVGIAFGKYRDRRFGARGRRIVRGPQESHRKIATWKVASDPFLVKTEAETIETT